MFEKHVCPICWAFQNPATGRCLVCGKAYTIFDGPPLDLMGPNHLQDYCVPVTYNGKTGYLTFRGKPYISNEQNGCNLISSFTLEMDAPQPEDSIFQLTLIG